MLKDQTLTFQKAWYEKYPWLHVRISTDGVLCLHCSKYLKTGKPAQAKSTDPVKMSGWMWWVHQLSGKLRMRSSPFLWRCQEAMCLHHVDTDLLVREDFTGLYETTSTTGENLARIILDVLMRQNLPILGLRGQAYDRALNMAGKCTGCYSASTATSTIYTLWSTLCQFSYTTSLHSLMCCEMHLTGYMSLAHFLGSLVE